MRIKRHPYTKKLIPKHQDFVNKYVCTWYDSHKIYGRAFFCEDEDIAIVRRNEDYDNLEAWGCVNMANQLLVPFEYRKIWDYGRFLIAKNISGTFLYNKKGKFLYDVESVEKTEHKAYLKLYSSYEPEFRLMIRKMAISTSVYQDYYVLENGLCFLQNTDYKVGIVLFSKLKMNFEYEAIAIPQNGYTLAIKESSLISKDNSVLYDCLLIKVKSQIKKEGSIHPTGITLFSGKSWDETLDYFKDTDTFEKECNSIVCYNEKVIFDAFELVFFPFDIGLPNFIDEIEDKNDERPYYCERKTFNRYNGSYAQDVEGWSDQDIDIVFDGDPDAYWNID